MSSAQDPFYVVKEEIQDSIDKLQVALHKLEQTPFETGERVNLTRELVRNCESIEWQVDELNKAIAVAARDPDWFGLDGPEIERRSRWTTSAHNQERILNELSMEVETTSNRLEFIQKKVAMVMKKAGAKGQIMMIFFLIFLLIILFVLLFLT